jgi:hypothetical protein
MPLMENRRDKRTREGLAAKWNKIRAELTLALSLRRSVGEALVSECERRVSTG